MSLRALPTLTVICAIALAGSVAGAAELPDDVSFLRQTQLLVPRAEAAFVIDGTVSEAERAACAAIDQFLTFDPEATAAEGSTAWLAHTGDALYLAFAFDRPEGAPPVASAAEFDEIALWKLDDAAELMLTVGNTTWDFIGNSAGIRGDYVHRPQNWDFSHEAWRYDARVTDAGWEGEFLIPAEVLGLDGFGPDVDVTFDLVNNAKSLSMSLLSYRGGHWHANMDFYPRLHFGASGQSYQTEQALGALGDEKMGLRATVANPSGEAREIDVWAAFYRAPDDEEVAWFSEVGGLYQTEGIAILPGATDDELIRLLAGNALDRYVQAGVVDETLTVPPGGTADVDLWRHSFTGSYVVAHLLRDAATGTVLSGGVYPFTVAPPLKTDIHYYYLTSRRIYALTLVPSDGQVDALRYQVIPAAGGEPVGEEIAVDLQPGARAKTPISSAGWPAGDYTLFVEALDAGGGVLQSSSVAFTKPPTPEWFGSDAGNQIAVSWPWTPVQANENAVEVWGRRYEFSDGPLPARIVSRGEEILTEPARLAVSVGGSEAQWAGEAPALESTGEDAAVYRARQSAAGLQMDASTTVEFDGMMRFDLMLSAEEPVSVDRLFVEVPVSREVARMFSRYALGLMPANARPAEWDDLPFAGWVGDDAITLPFTPSLVLRNDDVGIEWFAEWDLGWANADRARRIEILPGDDEVLLRIRLIDTPTEIAGERTITFGLEAWPVKPWPEKEMHVTNYAISDWANDEDWDFEEQLRRMIDLGLDVYEWFHWNSFTTDTGAKHPPEYPMLPPEGKGREEIIEAARIAQELGIPIIGHCGYALPPTTPVFEYYGREMAVHPVNNKGAWGYKFTADSPFPDAWVDGFKDLAEQFGWSGVQLDGAFSPGYHESEETGSAQRGPDGRLHGKYPIFAYRDFARRLYNVYHGEVEFAGIEHGFVYTHLGSHAIGPIHAFSDAIHSGESTRTMRVPHLSQIDLDLERAVYAAGALGVPRHWLLKHRKAPHGPQGRIATALQMDMIPAHNHMLQWVLKGNSYAPDAYPAHQVWAAREWIGANPETFVWYDESERYATVGGENAYLSLHVRPGEKALLAVSNWDGEERELPVALKLDALGLAGETLRAEDAITGEPVALDGAAMTLQVRGDNYRLIKVFAQEAE